jgi:anti-sigma regulatory factor (Ser/Thr protein kinase)
VSVAGVSLRPEPSSVRVARQYVDGQLEALGFSLAVSVAELLVSELVTNAILHAHTVIEVTVDQHDDLVRVSVADNSPRSLRKRHHSVDSGTGRGLWLVERLATRWGVEPTSSGKVVWFELPREPAESAGWGDAWEA